MPDSIGDTDKPTHLYRRHVRTSKEPADPRIVNVVRWVQADPFLSITDLACRLHLSVTRVSHLFKQETGVPFKTWLTEERLQGCAKLLLLSDDVLKIIASSAGYHHLSSFVRAFQRHFSMSPKRYRRASQKSTQSHVAE
jgi:transcriptional regulator GlxA family with amidase domain